MYYHLTHPYYESDHDWNIKNPIEIVNSLWLPGIICPSCGTWASSRRTYRKIIKQSIKEFLNKKPLIVENWRNMEVNVRQYLEIDDKERLYPGEIIGDPVANISRKAILSDFIFAWTGEMVVKENVVIAFTKANLTGVSFIKLVIDNHEDLNLDSLFVLIPKGIIMVKNQDIELCELCDRPRNSQELLSFPIDLSLEKFDIFSPENNPNIIFISEKCKKIIEENAFSNIEIKPFL